MPLLRDNLNYALSLPERTLRAAAAGLGGLLYEAAGVLLPGWLRRSRLYRAIVAGTLRIAIELVGGATGILPPDEVTAQELAQRKAAMRHFDPGHLSYTERLLWRLRREEPPTGKHWRKRE
jgi:hypothetical protein